MRLPLDKFMTGAILLAISFGCTTTFPNQSSSANVTATPTPTATQTSYNSTTNRPATKTDTISIEGEKVPVTLRLYDQYSNLFTTYFPEKDFLVEGVSSGEGTGVKFTANFGGNRNDNAYVQVSFLNDFQTLERLRNFVNGKNGLIASNRWQLGESTQKVGYAWAIERIAFRQGNNIVGNLYLGQQNGRVFYVITHYPVEYGDGFPPRADLILKNLQVAVNQ
jgi:hypothetical protein